MIKRKTICTTLVLAALLSPLSAMAESGHSHSASHAQSQQELMADGKQYTDAALKLMTQGNEFVKLGQQKKDAKLMMQGAKMLKMSYSMHHHAMHGMKEMHGEMKAHLVKAMLGEMTMSPAQVNEVKATMQGLEKALKDYHTAFHVQEAKIKDSGTILVAMGAHMVQKANSAAQAEQSLMGGEMLEMGMYLQTLHGGGHHDREEKMDKHSGGHRMIRKEVEIRIEK